MNSFFANQLSTTTLKKSTMFSSLKEMLNRPVIYPVAFGTNYVVRTPMLFTTVKTDNKTVSKPKQYGAGNPHFMFGNK